MKNDEVLRNNSVNYIQITTKVYFVKQLILNEVSDKTRLWVTAHTTSSPILKFLAVTPNVSTVKVTDGNGRNVSNFNKAEFYKNAPFRFICLKQIYWYHWNRFIFVQPFGFRNTLNYIDFLQSKTYITYVIWNINAYSIHNNPKNWRFIRSLSAGIHSQNRQICAVALLKTLYYSKKKTYRPLEYFDNVSEGKGGLSPHNYLRAVSHSMFFLWFNSKHPAAREMTTLQRQPEVTLWRTRRSISAVDLQRGNCDPVVISQLPYQRQPNGGS